MLKNTFHHIRGIGSTTERRLWDAGILSWEDLLNGSAPLLSRKKRQTLTAAIEESIQHLEARNPHYFGQRLPSNQCWRLFKDFRDRIAYLDIETTGLEGEITTIALYDGQFIRTYVRGRNLNPFQDDIYEYDVIVTYNGKCFDVPFIESDLDMKLNQVHIDLRYLLKSVGFSGGIKGCERKAGIERRDVAGLEGYHAPILWEQYKDGNRKALVTLLAYNCQDTINLETLMVMAYNPKLKDTPFRGTHDLPLPIAPEIQFKADLATVDRVKNMGGWSW
jgi:uncharacterized protein YprB with RNaseH-like and TPR domain